MRGHGAAGMLPLMNPQTDDPAAQALLPHEFHLRLSGHEWAVRHAGLILSHDDEQIFLTEIRAGRRKVPYGVALWPAAIALAHEIAARADGFAGRRVLELGAGTGLPGIVAAALGAKVVQTDKEEVALELCRHNGRRNNASGIEVRSVDWTEWNDPVRYDWIVGSDILYAGPLHPHLRRIFEENLAPGGRLLLSDPFRAVSLPLLEQMEVDGWSVTLTRWSMAGEGEGGGAAPRPVAVYELTPPAGA